MPEEVRHKRQDADSENDGVSHKPRDNNVSLFLATSTDNDYKPESLMLT
jgi:hypothetical protein